MRPTDETLKGFGRIAKPVRFKSSPHFGVVESLAYSKPGSRCVRDDRRSAAGLDYASYDSRMGVASFHTSTDDRVRCTLCVP